MFTKTASGIYIYIYIYIYINSREIDFPTVILRIMVKKFDNELAE